MKLASKSFDHDARIPEKCAAGVPGAKGPVPGPNLSPHLSWSDAPAATKSFAILCRDADAPSKADDVNKTDRTVPHALPRADFFHWVLVDVPATLGELAEGADSNGFVPKGKPIGKTDHGVRGVNDYTGWFAGDAAMAGDYGGYDGPWPPFNDERVHHYHFTLYALDVASLGLTARFTAADALQAMKGHVLAQATWSGSYALNPAARA